MSRLGNTGVGEVFARPPARTSGLQGKLAPRPQLVPAPPAEIVEVPAAIEPPVTTPISPTRPSSPRERGSGAASPDPEPRRATTTRPMTLVYVTQSDRAWIAEERASGRTTAQIVLAAIEAHADQLPAQFRSSSPKAQGMFTTSTAAQAPREPYVQLGMSGIVASDLAVLTKLVEDVNAPSLSALVRAALRLERAHR